MYHSKLWEEERRSSFSGYKSSGYKSHPAKTDSGKYHWQKYGSKGSKYSSDYIRNEENKQKQNKRNKASSGQEKIEKQGMTEDELPFMAAEQLFNESKNEQRNEVKKKDIKTIEDAINNAIEDEKKIVVMDN